MLSSILGLLSHDFSKFQNDSEHVFEIVGDTCCKLEHHRKSILEIGSNLHFLSLCQVSHHQDPSQMLGFLSNRGEPNLEQLDRRSNQGDFSSCPVSF